MNLKMDEHIGLLKALCLNAIIGLLTLTNIEMMLKYILLALSIGYTAWKWFEDYKKSKK